MNKTETFFETHHYGLMPSVDDPEIQGLSPDLIEKVTRDAETHEEISRETITADELESFSPCEVLDHHTDTELNNTVNHTYRFSSPC